MLSQREDSILIDMLSHYNQGILKNKYHSVQVLESGDSDKILFKMTAQNSHILVITMDTKDIDAYLQHANH